MTEGTLVEFTATEKRILILLNDGKPHSKEEVHACLSDELASIDAIHVHLAKIRPKLETMGQAILCKIIGRRPWYQHVRLLHSPNDGRR